MKTFIILSFLAIAYAQHSGDKDATILSQESDISPDGSYKSSYATSNGIQGQEQGAFKSAGRAEEGAEEVQGAFQYTAPDGTQIGLQYLANENGFQPQGAHLPLPHPIPAQIARALDWIAAHPQKEEPGKRPF